MLVSQQNLSSCLAALVNASAISLDTETTGLFPWQNDRLFSIVCATNDEEYYFDFSSELPRDIIAHEFGELLRDKQKIVYMHNAKFDMAMLYQEGVRDFDCIIWDNMVMARVWNNDLMSYSLDSLAPYVGQEKDSTLKKYALEHELWAWAEDANGKRYKSIHYAKIPLEIIQPYAEIDARVTYDLGVFLARELKKQDDGKPDYIPSVLGVINEELQTTKTLFTMERHGVLLDAPYAGEAKEYEYARTDICRQEFKSVTGREFVDSAKVLKEVFTSDSERFERTEKGNLSFTSDILSRFESPLAQTILEHRDAYKRARTYFTNYQCLVDSAGRIHPNFRQTGAATLRLSCADPNFQNVTKGKDKQSRYPIRRCFIPPPGFYWVSFDYDQMEYRLMLDYAGEQPVIKRVLEGLDVHQATADMMGVERDQAKTLNFALLYGSGAAALADALKLSFREATELKGLYFSRLPKVAELINNIVRRAKERKLIYNWLGQAYKFTNPNFTYKAPNYLIQGGCSHIVKRAMNRVDALLRARKADSAMVLQVHDELDFYISQNELDLIPEIKAIMEGAYTHKYLPLTAGVSISGRSWADVVDIEKWQDSEKVSFQIKSKDSSILSPSVGTSDSQLSLQDYLIVSG